MRDMKDFGLDNAGSGFAMDDDADIDAMLNAAGDGEPEEEAAPAEIFTGEAPAEPAPVRTPEPAPVVQEDARVPEPVVAPAPVPAVVPEPAETRKAPKIPTLADDKARVGAILAIADAYRALSAEEQAAASQLMTGGELLESETDVVVTVLNIDPMVTKTMTSLKEARELDDVERSFFIMDLEPRLMDSLGSLVSVFVAEDVTPGGSRTQFAKRLVRLISTLDSKSMSFIAATESVLNAGGGQA